MSITLENKNIYCLVMQYSLVTQILLFSSKQVPVEQLIRLLTVMERHIRDGVKLRQPAEQVRSCVVIC